jgi:CSLREA domain-containing protein
MERSADASKETAPVRRRRVALILAGALAAALLAVPVAGAHGATVTKLADTDGECTPADCSLREAIGTGDSSIDFAPGLAGRINLQSELPQLSHDVEIRGPGAKVLTVRRSAGDVPWLADYAAFRIFTVSGGVSVEISGLTIENGRPLSNCLFGECPPNPDSGYGGGIFNPQDATLTVRDSIVRENESLGTGHGSIGGGIHNEGTMALISSTVSENQALGGGGISNGGAMTIVNSTVSENGEGGEWGTSESAIHLSRGTLEIINSTVGRNWYLISAIESGLGGGRLSVRASTIANNRQPRDEEGGEQLAVRRDAKARLRSTIIAVGGRGEVNCAVDPRGSLISRGYNLADDRSCNLARRSDQPNTDPGLGPLADNGGPTHTMALLPASPAIDRGIGDDLGTDQRGLPRPVDFPWVPNAPGGDASDIGAFERQVLASNRFRFRKLIRNRTQGTASQRLWVASSGRVVLRRNKRVRGFARRVEGPGVVAVRVRPRGNAKRRLARAGEERGRVAVRVRARITFNPQGGPPRTKAKRLRLVRVGDR